MKDNQQPSIINKGLKFLTRTEKRKGKWYGLYKCPLCNNEVEVRIDVVNSHYKKHDYPKYCSKCANKLAGNKRVRHGDTSTRLYSIWKNMRSRTSEKSVHRAYKNISVCKEWDKYENFKNWALSNGYNDNLTIDRIDPNKDYNPSNCRFISLSENSARANKRGAVNSIAKLSLEDEDNIKILLAEGYTHQHIADKFNVARTTITYINNKGSTTISKESRV